MQIHIDLHDHRDIQYTAEKLTSAIGNARTSGLIQDWAFYIHMITGDTGVIHNEE
jgi:hypothetical protein